VSARGVVAYVVVALEGRVEAVYDVVQLVSLIFGVDASLLVGAVLVEVGLYRYDAVVVVDADGAHPRVVGANDVDVLVSEPYTAHDGRNEHVAGARHGESLAVGKRAEDHESLDTDGVDGDDVDIRVVAHVFG
jgi:hypothetical protein